MRRPGHVAVQARVSVSFFTTIMSTAARDARALHAHAPHPCAGHREGRTGGVFDQDKGPTPWTVPSTRTSSLILDTRDLDSIVAGGSITFPGPGWTYPRQGSRGSTGDGPTREAYRFGAVSIMRMDEILLLPRGPRRPRTRPLTREHPRWIGQPAALSRSNGGRRAPTDLGPKERREALERVRERIAARGKADAKMRGHPETVT